MLIDTHTHLVDESFDEDREAVLARAHRAGVVAIIAVGETLEEAEKNLALARSFSGVVFPAAGLFPTILDRDAADALCAFAREHRRQLIAIGEVGLDHWKVQDPGEREIQSQIFRQLIDLAIELDLPLNVHSRAAGRPTIDLLLNCGARRVQLHAFDGRAAKAMPAVEAGYFFSVPPSIVRSAQKQKLVRRLPLESLLVETDSPVLGPQADQRNEPANLKIAVEAIAEIKEIPVAEVAAVVTANTRKLYGDHLPGGVGRL